MMNRVEKMYVKYTSIRISSFTCSTNNIYRNENFSWKINNELVEKQAVIIDPRTNDTIYNFTTIAVSLTLSDKNITCLYKDQRATVLLLDGKVKHVLKLHIYIYIYILLYVVKSRDISVTSKTKLFYFTKL